MFNKVAFYPAKILLTCFFLGKVKPFPGTLGSIVGVIICYIADKPTTHLAFRILFAFCIFLIFIIGILAANLYSKAINKQDPSEVILDEIIGQIVSIKLLHYFIHYAKYHVSFKYPVFQISLLHCFDISLLSYLVSFVFFRIFDIAKPHPISYVDKNIKGGLGIMLDDIIAGIFASVASLTFLIILNYIVSA
jgi:phosphatidylglycerophosphatase A